MSLQPNSSTTSFNVILISYVCGKDNKLFDPTFLIKTSCRNLCPKLRNYWWKPGKKLKDTIQALAQPHMMAFLETLNMY